MKEIAIIPCAGDSARWNRYLGLEKELIPVGPNGETLLGRTVRLLRQNGVHDIYVMTHKREIREAPLDVTTIAPASSDYLTSTILSSKMEWTDRNIILLGDVYFSDYAIRTVVSDEAPIKFFGIVETSAPVMHLGSRPEIFAFAFNKTEAEPVAEALSLSSLLASVRDSGSKKWFWTLSRLRHLVRLDLRNSQVAMGKVGLLRTFFRYNSPPWPPTVLKRLGFRPNPIWRIGRWMRSGISGDSRLFGRLWGLYMLLSQSDPLEGEIRSGLGPDDAMFEEISDHTVDCDFPTDYHRLLFLIHIIEQHASAAEDEPCRR